MLWEDLTAPQFEQAVRDVGGVCLLALGCLERHADHLPLGTDFLIGSRICELAAQREPALVFPCYYFTQINEARCFPGTVAIDPMLTLQLLRNVCDEIARNGCEKIILFNAHGGNAHLIGYLLQTALAKRQDYALYFPDMYWPDLKQQRDAVVETTYHGHACECETSLMLHEFGELVRPDQIRGDSPPLNRLKHLPGGSAVAGWYADHPEHYAGDARPASADKGRKLMDIHIQGLSTYIKAVKQDTVTPALMGEFYDRCDRIGK